MGFAAKPLSQRISAQVAAKVVFYSFTERKSKAVYQTSSMPIIRLGHTFVITSAAPSVGLILGSKFLRLNSRLNAAATSQFSGCC
jgi:hypothetical protein